MQSLARHQGPPNQEDDYNRRVTLRELWKDVPGLRAVAPLSYSHEESFVLSRPEESQPEDAELIESTIFEAHSSAKAGGTGFTHFLDGAQKAIRCGYAGMDPIVLAHTSAAIVERSDRQIAAPEEDKYSAALELFATTSVPCPLEMPLHVLPPQEKTTGIANEERLAKEVSNTREARETALARAFQGECLLMDGGIGKAINDRRPDAFLVGMVKSHQRQYFQSEARIQVILDLKPGERTTVFRRTGSYSREADVASFYLRLREDPHQGPLFGLVRVELPISDSLVARADDIAAWILHERDPLSLPDARFDRMLYPIRLVEKHLKARQPSEAAMRAIVGL